MKKLLLIAGILSARMLYAQQGQQPERAIALLQVQPGNPYHQRSQQPDSAIALLPAEQWWGGAVNEAHHMPFGNGYLLDLNGDNRGNQAAPLLVSSAGRYIWSEQPFRFRIQGDTLFLSRTAAPVNLVRAGLTLADAYRAAAARFFAASGKMPDSLLITHPQYNTWIELIYDQNQADILKYAHSIIANGFPPGVMMIDDNWFSNYGSFVFRKDRFPDAKAMVQALHRMGFKVMVWVSPFISPDTDIFREARDKRIILFDNKGNDTLQWQYAAEPALIRWWNGYSAELDLTNPAAVQWFREKLHFMQATYGIDGFKFDAGDTEFYPPGIVSFRKANANEHCELWGQFGLEYPLNEYRAMWKRGGQPLVERLRDKLHTWEDLQKLVPHLSAAGLLGYPFACPDMIGGGDFSSFTGNVRLDQDLVVRSAQCHALMPMMQFSVAPWRILDSTHLNAVKKAVALRQRMVPYIMQLAKRSAITGMPIVRNMEFAFPHQGYEQVKDQFMLGDQYLVAPVLTPQPRRKVIFPKGAWQAVDGTIIKGPVVKELDIPIDQLAFFRLIHT